MQEPKQKEMIRIKGPYRIINYTLEGRPVYISHPQFKKLMTSSGGRLPLAGPPRGIDLDITVKLDVEPAWRDKNPVKYVADLTTYPIKGLAPGLVYVEQVRGVFLFYANCWFHLDQSLLNREEPTDEEEGQQRFSKAILSMEKQQDKFRL